MLINGINMVKRNGFIAIEYVVLAVKPSLQGHKTTWIRSIVTKECIPDNSMCFLFHSIAFLTKAEGHIWKMKMYFPTEGIKGFMIMLQHTVKYMEPLHFDKITDLDEWHSQISEKSLR